MYCSCFICSVSCIGEVKVTRVLDRETTPQYSLIIEASDQSYTSTTELIITLTDVNDESPVFSKSQYSFSVSEKAAINEVNTYNSLYFDQLHSQLII